MVQMLGAHKKTPAGTTKNEHPCTFFVCEFAVRTRFRLKPLPTLAVLIRRGFSKAAWMPSVLSNSDVFCFAKKLACKFWHGSQFRTDKDVRGIRQTRCFDVRQNSQSKMYKDVHFWRCVRDCSDSLFAARRSHMQFSTWGETLLKWYKRSKKL